MEFIKEPDGVDSVIHGKPLTEKEKREISEFINADKKRLAKLKKHKRKSTNSQQTV